MSIAQLCGLSYALQIDLLERETLAAIGVIGAAWAQGAEVEIPTLDKARADFQEWLMSDIEEMESAELGEQALMRRALGLREVGS